MSSLSDFQDLVNGIEEPKMIEVAEELLRDMIKIEDMKERLEKLEDGLSEGDRAAFWFFAIGLEGEQIGIATNTVLGRKRVLADREERAKNEAKRMEDSEGKDDV